MPEASYYSAFRNRSRIIHIVDPDLQTCETLSVLFRVEGLQTAFSVNLSGFLATLERRRPDVVVANIDLGDDSGLSLLRRVRSMRLGTPVLMLEDRPAVAEAVAAVRAGALDVFTKPLDSERLLGAVDDALRGHAGAMEVAGRPIDIRGFVQLTPREREVLVLITSGQSNKEAGRELGISPRTIEVHRARVMEKLGAKNTADLMRIVLSG